ncbi:MAG: polysaccharide biosynthesis C-terminal domain-containing protein [Acidobacteria bacterium]|nr:polysaccharide biosynthesis C-terminal domain-containing protein [Acidobacteriota bacterium]
MTAKLAYTRRSVVLRRRLGENHLVRGSLALLLGSVGASLTGYVYWVYLSRRFGATVIGEVSALGAVAAVVSLLHAQSVGSSILTRLHALSNGSRRALIRASLLCVGLFASLAGALAASALVLLDAAPTLRNPLFFAVFVSGVAAQSAGATLDAAALALRSSRTSALRNSFSSALRFPLLLLALMLTGPAAGTPAVLTTATVVSILSVVWLLRRLDGLVPPGASGVSLRSVFGDLRRGAWPQAFVALGSGVPAQVLPVIVVALAGANAGGHFSMAWLVGSACFMVPPTVCSSLLTEGSRDLATLGRRVRHASALIALLLVVPVTAYLFAGGRVLAIFGSGFSSGGHAVLAVLAISALPNTVFNIAVSVLRAHERLVTAAKVSMVGGATTVLLAAVLVPLAGGTGAAAGWLVGQLVGAVAGGFACRDLRSPRL